jgi:hypothetical protein
LVRVDSNTDGPREPASRSHGSNARQAGLGILRRRALIIAEAESLSTKQHNTTSALEFRLRLPGAGYWPPARIDRIHSTTVSRMSLKTGSCFAFPPGTLKE